MSEAVYDTVSVKIEANGYRFTASGSKLSFDGFMSVYATDEQEKESSNIPVELLEKGKVLEYKDQEAKQHFTQPPAHYTEAALVKT
ncbi:MAG: type I DNA topoisomerase, partial [Selenomonadaceae bacterium]|nr:type I DNA topoisomerase [Selenomonadaceae bacterium]